jgi:hypothetical protein
MKHLKIAGLCLVAVFVLSAVATTAASARPTKPYWDQCSKVENAGEGEWQDSLCSVKHTGSENALWVKAEINEANSSNQTKDFQECAEVQETNEGFWKNATCSSSGLPRNWAKVTQKHQFTSTSGPSELLIENSETSKFKPVKCKSDTNEGHVIGPKHVLVTVHFKGCESEVKGVVTPCKSANAAAGEIVTKQLKGWLFYIKSTAPVEVGLWLAANGGKEFAAFECATQKVIVRSIEKISEAVEPETGSCIAGKVSSPLNAMEKQGSLAFEENPIEKGKQAIEKFEYEGKKLHCRLKVKIGTEEFNSTQITKEDSIEWEDAMQLNA